MSTTKISKLYSKPENKGKIAVNKTYMVEPSMLFVEEGFNIRELDMDHVRSLSDSYKAGEYIPALVVEPQENNTMKIIDGHHRFEAIKLAISEGVEIKRVNCEGFNGSASDQLTFMIKSSQGRNLSPIDRGMAYLRYERYGFTREEIAEQVGRSFSDVVNHINIAELPEEVKEKVRNEEIAVNLALELINKGGVKAVTDAIDNAKANGRKKATRSNTKLWKPKLGKDTVERLSNAKVIDTDSDDVTIKVNHLDWEYIKEAMDLLKQEKGQKEPPAEEQLEIEE